PLAPPLALTVRVTSPEMGCPHPTIAAAADTAVAAIRVRAFSRARRLASLCKNVMASAPSRIQELAHVRRARRRPRITRHPEELEHRAERTRMEVRRARRVPALRPRADGDPFDLAPTVGVVAARLIERDDEATVLRA